MSATDDKIVAFLFPAGRAARESAAALALPEPENEPQLPLGDRPRVVELPKARKARPLAPVLPQTSDAFERAWKAYPDAGRRRSSRVEAWPQWVRVASAVGEDQLADAVVAYAADPVELTKESGAPGLHIWLKRGRWEHWLGATPVPGKISQSRVEWTGPPAIWEAAAGRYGEPWARSWLARCTWDAERATLAAPTSLAAEKLWRDLKTELAFAGVRRIITVKEGREVGQARVLANPQPIPESIVQSFRETFTAAAPREWLDACSWERRSSTILSPRDLRPEWAAGPFAAWARQAGVMGWRRV